MIALCSFFVFFGGAHAVLLNTGSLVRIEDHSVTHAQRSLGEQTLLQVRRQENEEDMLSKLRGMIGMNITSPTEAISDEFDCAEPAAEYNHFPELTCKVVRDNIVNGYLFMTFANGAGFQLARSWAHNLRKALGVDLNIGKGPLLAAMESGAKAKAEQLWGDEGIKLPSFLLGNAVPTKGIDWGGKVFNTLGQEKVRLIQQLVEMGNFRFTLTDADAFWVTNPIPYFSRFPDADMLASTDNLATPFLLESAPQQFVRHPKTLDRDPTSLVERGVGQINIGVLMFKGGSEGCKLLAQTWLSMLSSGNTWDQAALNQLLHARWVPQSYDPKRNLVSSKGVVWGLLNPVQFTGGQTYWVGQAHLKLEIPAYTVHADYTNCGIPGKVAKFRAAGLWQDTPEYYQGKFLLFDLHVPEELLIPYEDVNIHFEAPERHLRLVDHQLKQIAHAAAIAYGLNRTLVIPEIKCICEYVWYPGQSRKCRWSGGTAESPVPTSMPYACPPDQVFKVARLEKIPHRWSSFLNDPKFPYGSADTVTVSMDKGSSMDQIRGRLQKFKDNILMKIDGFTPDLFAGFTRQEEVDAFTPKTRGVVSNWCCSTANMADNTIGYKSLEDARDSWLFGATPAPETKCIADRSVQKVTNARGSPWPGGVRGDWWGVTYPITADEMCGRRAKQSKCKSTSLGLCKARPGLEESQEDKDNWQELVQEQEEKKRMQQLQKTSVKKKTKVALYRLQNGVEEAEEEEADEALEEWEEQEEGAENEYEEEDEEERDTVRIRRHSALLHLKKAVERWEEAAVSSSALTSI